SPPTFVIPYCFRLDGPNRDLHSFPTRRSSDLEFERTAGVQFVELADGNRKHIRQWLSFEASTNTVAATESAKEEVLALAAEETRSEEHTSELQSHLNLVCRLLLEKKKKQKDVN